MGVTHVPWKLSIHGCLKSDEYSWMPKVMAWKRMEKSYAMYMLYQVISMISFGYDPANKIWEQVNSPGKNQSQEIQHERLLVCGSFFCCGNYGEICQDGASHAAW